jgi:transcriptional regulator with XRE-family HTH domain
MTGHISRLIHQLISTAKAEGMSQAELASRAGLSPVGLSKAKRRGNLHASTLVALGRELDLELVFVPRKQTEAVSGQSEVGNNSDSLDKKGDADLAAEPLFILQE